MPPNNASSFFSSSSSFLFLVSITLPNLLFLFIQATLGRITKHLLQAKLTQQMTWWKEEQRWKNKNKKNGSSSIYLAFSHGYNSWLESPPSLSFSSNSAFSSKSSKRHPQNSSSRDGAVIIHVKKKKKKKKQIEIPSNHSLKAHQTIMIIGLSPQAP
jgi:hypothetical protein